MNEPTTEVVTAAELKAGDTLFTFNGTPLTLTEVFHRRGRAYTTQSDGAHVSWPHTATVTVIKRLTDQEQEDAIRELIARGLTLSTALSAFAEQRTDLELRYVDTAREHNDPGVLEVDSNALVSHNFDLDDYDGAYVLAWMWIGRDEAEGD